MVYSRALINSLDSPIFSSLIMSSNSRFSAADILGSDLILRSSLAKLPIRLRKAPASGARLSLSASASSYLEMPFSLPSSTNLLYVALVRWILSISL